MNYAAHELLETTEALRTKAAEIEQHGAFAAQCNDQALKGILMKHQQQMVQAYQQGVSLVQGKGGQLTHQAPNFSMQQQHNIGMQQQQQSSMSAPQMNTQSLSDQTMATLALNTHKSGSMMGMLWANECVDPQLRMYHVNGANLCQEMAYEIWSWMNQNGYYQPATFSESKVNQMTSMYQPMQQSTNTMQMNQMGRNYQ